MLGYIRTSDTSQTGLRCLCIPHPASYPRTSWLRKIQIVWLQWSSQPWHHLWIGHSRVTGPYVQLEPCATTWTGLQTSGRIRSSSLFVSFKKGFDKDISPATISSWIKQTVVLCYELSDQEALTLHQVKAHDVRAFAASKAFQSGISLDQILSACHWKSHLHPILFEGCCLGRLRAFPSGTCSGCSTGAPPGPEVRRYCIYVNMYIL